MVRVMLGPDPGSSLACGASFRVVLVFGPEGPSLFFTPVSRFTVGCAGAVFVDGPTIFS